MSKLSLSHEQRKEYSELSKDVFGSSSRWEKLLSKGLVEPVTTTMREFLPSGDEDGGGTEKDVEVPVTVGKSTVPYLHVKRFTVESVKDYMLERKKKVEEVRAFIAKMQAEQKANRDAAELKAKLQDQVGGSAL